MFTEEQKQIVYPQYAQLICEPSRWFEIAQYLFASSEKLGPEIDRLWGHMWDSIQLPAEDRIDSGPFYPFDYQRVYLMLIAFCLENMMKGCIVKNYKEEIYSEAKRSGELPRLLKSHSLQELAKKCLLILNADEHTLLQRLSSHAVWIGRYPYPLRADQFYSFAEGSNIPGNAIGWGSNEIAVTKAFVEKIAMQLDMQLRPDN